MTALTDFVSQTIWGLEAGVHSRMCALVFAHAAGERVSAERIEEIVAAREKKAERDLPTGYELRDGVGVVPVSGVIARHARQVNGMSQPRGTSLEQITSDLQSAFSDPSANSVMLAIDSPGGSVDGIVDFTDTLRAMRVESGKPMVAHVAGASASLAYWIASQADKVIATRGSSVGSIGARATLVDDHRRLEGAGISFVHLGSTKGKVDGPQMGTAIGPNEIAAVQTQLDQWHARFVDAVATGRKVDPKKVGEWAKDSAMFDAQDALSMGLIDAIGTEASAMDSLRKRAEKRDVTAGNNDRGRKMNAQIEGAPQAVAPSVPTSAHDLRETYPEAVQAIERDAVARALKPEQDRVAAIVKACTGKGEAVIRVGLNAIASGSSAVDALTAMLEVTPVAAAPVSATSNQFPTPRTFATSQVQPLGSAPLPEAPKNQERKPRSVPEARREWDALSPAQRSEFHNDFAWWSAATGGLTVSLGGA